MPIQFGDILSHSANNDALGAPTGITVNPISDSNELLGGTKSPTTSTLADGLWESITVGAVTAASGERNTLRCLSSLVYLTDSSPAGFHVLTGTQGDTGTYAWQPLGDHLGVSLGGLKIQDPGTSTAGAGQVTDFTTDAIAVDSLRLGSLDAGGLTVALTNEVTANGDDDTFRISLKNSANLAAEYDMTASDNFKVMMWNNSANQLEGSPIAVSSDGTNQTVTISGSLDVTGTLTQGVNVTASSLDVTNQYIKSNDGYENVDNASSLSQGGLLVQTGWTTDDDTNNGTVETYNQRGFYWDGAQECWYIGPFTSTSTASNATYTEVSAAPDGTVELHHPVFKLSTANEIHFPRGADGAVGSGGYTDTLPWNFHYMTPNSAFTYLAFGDPGSDFDIDTNAQSDISNQSMILGGVDAATIALNTTSESGVQLIAAQTTQSAVTTGFESYNKVRTARILNIRAIATDQNVSDKSLKLKLPNVPDGFYEDLLMISIYKITGNQGAHQREEIFGAEVIDGADGSQSGLIEISFNQLGMTAGDVFDIVIVC